MTVRWRMAGSLIVLGSIVIYMLALLDVPIFFDEAAFRRFNGRALIDGFAQMNFFPQCASSVESAWLLRPAHLLLSWVDSWPHWAGLRSLPLLSCLLLAASAWLLLPRNDQGRISIGLLSSGFVGVAGVGLILSRPEFVQCLYLAVCAATWWLAQRPANKGWVVAFATIAHLAIATLALLVHQQALLIVPLSFIVSMRLLRQWPWAAALVAVLIVFTAFQGLQQSQYRCSGDPELEAVVKETHGAVYSRTLESHAWPLQMAYRIKHHVELFFFYEAPRYSVPVPGVSDSVARMVNPFIGLVVAINLAALVVATAWALLQLWRSYRVHVRKWEIRRLINLLAADGRAVWTLAALLLIFYSCYDHGGMFYRAHWRNMLTAWLLAVGVAYYPPSRWIRRWVIFVVVTSLLSTMVLWAFVRPELRGGFESYYVSLQRDWSKFDERVRTLAKRCGIPADAANVVSDIATYRALREHPRPIDYNYVWYYFYLKNNEMPKRSEKQWLDYYKKFSTSGYVVRCRSLESAPLPVQYRDEDLCCHGFAR